MFTSSEIPNLVSITITIVITRMESLFIFNKELDININEINTKKISSILKIMIR